MATVLNSHRILRATFTLTILIFFFAIGLGIYQSLSSYHRLPPINSHYMPEITALIENEDYDKAIPQLQLATSIDPDADASKNRDLVTSVRAAAATTSGKSLKDTGRFNEAILQYQKALIFLPDSATAHYNLANALQHQNRNQEALKHYQSTLRLEPTHAKAHGNMGGILQGHGRAMLEPGVEFLGADPPSEGGENFLRPVGLRADIPWFVHCRSFVPCGDD